MKGNRQLILSSQDDEICILGSVHHVLKTKRLKSSDIQVLPYLKKRNVQPRPFKEKNKAGYTGQDGAPGVIDSQTYP